MIPLDALEQAERMDAPFVAADKDYLTLLRNHAADLIGVARAAQDYWINESVPVHGKRWYALQAALAPLLIANSESDIPAEIHGPLDERA